MFMSRKTRKQLVGKTEEYEQRRRDREVRLLARELRQLWLSQAAGVPPKAA